MSGLEVRRARPDELARCLALRREVFVEEQGVPIEEEMDAHDAACAHFLALAAGEAVGTARLRVTDDGRVKAERVAVRRPFRRAGVGRALMRALEDEARARGQRELLLNAQVAVVAFYERLGYRAEGPEFLEADIPHRAMRKPLT
jgi:predicted GNAT family N-acyltransferase